jgi:hypothetical protein
MSKAMNRHGVPTFELVTDRHGARAQSADASASLSVMLRSRGQSKRARVQRSSFGLLLVLMIGVSVPAARANDSSFGGSGADLVPLSETRVRMVSEDIVLTWGRGWKVVADYVFENPTDEPVTLQMGFPEPKCIPDMDCDVDTSFKDLETTVRDAPVTHRKGNTSLSKLSVVLGTVWLYDVSFAPKERVHIRHTYRVGGTCGLSGWCDIAYITRTGARWAGPIENAKFRFRLPIWMNSLRYPKWSKPASIQMAHVGNDAFTEIAFEQTQWKPKADLWVAFEQEPPFPTWSAPDRRAPGIEPCPLDSDALPDAWAAVAAGETNVAELAKLWSRHSPEQLRTCVNNVFARYGRKFEANLYNRYFYGSKGWSPGKPPYKLYSPNPAFSNRALTAYDWAVLKVLRMARDLALVSRHEPPDPEPAPTPAQ